MKSKLFALRHWAVLSVVAIAIAIGASAAAQEIVRPVVIEIRDRAATTRRDVSLRDIAAVNGGPDALREQMAAVVIEELPPDGKSKTITQNQVRYCLRLAGFAATAFELSGASQALLVAERRPLTVDELFQAAKEEALRRLPWLREALSIRLMQPITAPLPGIAEGDIVALHTEPHQASVGLGRVQMNVTIRVNGERRLALPVYLEILPIQEIALARRSIARGDTVVESDLIRERRPVDPKDQRIARPDDVIGKKAHRDLPQGQVLQRSDVDSSSGATPAGQVIQHGQTVRMVAKLGAVDIIALGEAMQGGAIGQFIRVKNRESQKVIVGRVTGPKTVEIDFGNP